MSVKVLGISGSPIKDSNTDRLVTGKDQLPQMPQTNLPCICGRSFPGPGK